MKLLLTILFLTLPIAAQPNSVGFIVYRTPGNAVANQGAAIDAASAAAWQSLAPAAPRNLNSKSY